MDFKARIRFDHLLHRADVIGVSVEHRARPIKIGIVAHPLIVITVSVVRHQVPGVRTAARHFSIGSQRFIIVAERVAILSTGHASTRARTHRRARPLRTGHEEDL